MKASELRLGNYVLISNHDTLVKVPSTPEKVSGIISESELEFEWRYPGKTNFRVSLTHCSGISLSDEWLEKFGFSIMWDPKCNYRAVLGNFELCCGDARECYSFITLRNYHGDNEIKVELLYVHQLQNLYFFLTGNELEIKND